VEIIYEKTLSERIWEAIDTAAKENRKIKEIRVTHQELYELRSEFIPFFRPVKDIEYKIHFCGIPVVEV